MRVATGEFFSVTHSCCCLTGLRACSFGLGLGLNILVLFPSLCGTSICSRDSLLWFFLAAWRRVVADGLATDDIDTTVGSLFPSPPLLISPFPSCPYLPLPLNLPVASERLETVVSSLRVFWRNQSHRRRVAKTIERLVHFGGLRGDLKRLGSPMGPGGIPSRLRFFCFCGVMKRILGHKTHEIGNYRY